MRLLARDPGERPEEGELLELMGLGEERAPRGHLVPEIGDLPPRFIGREAERLHLDQAFEAAARGGPIVVHVKGPSGIGKTALVRHFLAELVGQGRAVTLSGRCYENELVPYKALDSLVDGLCRFLLQLDRRDRRALLPDVGLLARLFPSFARVDPRAEREALPEGDWIELRWRASQALRQLLRRLAGSLRLVLFIDDLQWGDPDSAALLADMLRPPEAPPVLLVLASRDESEEARRLVQILSEQVGGSFNELGLEPLQPGETRVLAQALLGQPEPGQPLSVIAQESGGNPFLVDDLVRYVRAGGQARQGAVARMVWWRVQQLDLDCRRLLQAIAANGEPIEEAVAFAAAGLGGDPLGIVTTLRNAHLVRSLPGGRLETFHDHIRRAVLDALPGGELAERHRAIAVVLEAAGNAEPHRLAFHWHRAGEPERAVQYALAAADKAHDRLAFMQAVRFYRLALELGLKDRTASMVQSRLGDALASAGRGNEAASAYLEAVKDVPEDQALHLRLRASSELIFAGQFSEGVTELRALLSDVGVAWPGSTFSGMLRYLSGRARNRLRGQDFEERPADSLPAHRLHQIDIVDTATVALVVFTPTVAMALQPLHLRLALEAGEPGRLAVALLWEAVVVGLGGRGSTEAVQRLLERARVLADKVDDPMIEARISLVNGFAAGMAGRWRDCLTFCDRADRGYRLTRGRTVWERDAAQILSMMMLAVMGQVSELERRRRRLVKEADERGSWLTRMGLRVWSYLALLAADEPDLARSELEHSVKIWPGEFQMVPIPLSTVDLYQGEGGRAWRRIAKDWPALHRAFMRLAEGSRVLVRWHMGVAALGAAAEGDRRLLAWVGRTARRLEREKASWSQGPARCLHACVAAQRGDEETAIMQFEAAEKAAFRSDMVLLAAICRRRRGELLGGDEGATLVRGADGFMEGQGVRRLERVTWAYAPISV
jgi:hypothetical protein